LSAVVALESLCETNIDVFPLDGAGDSREEAVKNFHITDIHRKFLLARTTGIRQGRKWYKNLSVVLARLIPSFLINNKKLLVKVDRLSRYKEYDESVWVVNSFGAWGEREITKKENIGSPTLYKFEDFSAYGVEKADEYLTGVYGDWRKLPPEEKRVSHHDFLAFDLNKSYLE